MPVRPPVPAVKDPRWSRNPIDAFIAAEQEKRGSRLCREADKRTLLRRVYLDLIGLPPTPEEWLRSWPTRARSLRKDRRQAAGQPALRRALGPALAGHLALLRLVWLALKTRCATRSGTSGAGATGPLIAESE